MRVAVAIVDDDAKFREGLAVVFDGAPGFRCSGAYPNAVEALKRMPGEPPDVVLLDIKMPGMTGVECIPELRRILPKVSVVMLTALDTDALIFEALSRGAVGYLLKGEPPARIVEAVAEVVAGGSPMSGDIARRVLTEFALVRRAVPAHPLLSPREQEILTLLSRGYRDKEIAAELGLAKQTISNTLRHVYRKLQARSRTEAVAMILANRRV